MTKIRLVPVREDGSIPPMPDDAVGLVRWFRGYQGLSGRGIALYERHEIEFIDKDSDVWAIEWIYA